MGALRHIGSIFRQWEILLTQTMWIFAMFSTEKIVSKMGRVFSLIFTARCYASAVLAIGLCLCLSVTSRSSTKTAKHRITQTTPHDSPGTLVFWCQRSPRISTGVNPYEGAECRWGGSKSATWLITGYIWKTVQDRHILPIKANRKLYALYRMVTLPMTLSAP